MSEAPIDVAGLDDNGAWFFIPFARMAIAEPAQLGPLQLAHLTWLSWRFIEKTELVDEHLEPMKEPKAVVGMFNVQGGSEEEGWKTAQTVCDAAAAALRLAGEANFIEPKLVALYSKRDSCYQRLPGHYRQAMLSELFQIVQHPLNASVLAEGYRLYQPVLHLLSTSSAAELLPLELFRQSFGPNLGSGDRLLFLFASLEALLLPWRTKVSGVALEARSALAATLGGTAVPEEMATGRARGVRNRLAHGEPDETAHSSMVGPMQELMRGALRCWLTFRTALPANVEPFQEFNQRLALAVLNGESGDNAARRVFAST